MQCTVYTESVDEYLTMILQVPLDPCNDYDFDWDSLVNSICCDNDFQHDSTRYNPLVRPNELIQNSPNQSRKMLRIVLICTLKEKKE